MAVFITGGHGHIASWAAYFLAREGESVMLYDIDPDPPDCLDKVSKNITFIKGDVLDFPRLSDIFRHHKGEIDGIIHTVGIMGEIVLDNPHHHVALNIAGTHNMLEIARQFEIPKVVYTSTGAVYGAVAGIVSEDRYPVNPSDLFRIPWATVRRHLRIRFSNRPALLLLRSGKTPLTLHTPLPAGIRRIGRIGRSENGQRWEPEAGFHLYRRRRTRHGPPVSGRKP